MEEKSIMKHENLTTFAATFYQSVSTSKEETLDSFNKGEV